MTTTPGTDADTPAPPEQDDAGISMTSVLVMLVVLGALVVGIFWGMPAMFGGQVIEVTIRN
jgi:hypothetical protein